MFFVPRTSSDKTRKIFLHSGCAITLALAATAPEPTAAQTLWNGSTSNDWTDGTNWSGNVVPTGNIDIRVTAPNPTVLGVGGAAVGTTGQLYVARNNGNTGNLTIQNGSTLTTNGYARIGEWNGSNGVVTVTGAGSSWAINGNISLIVGNFGTGTLNIDNSASVTVNHPSGFVFIGRGGPNTGTLNITNGGTLTTGGVQTIVGRDAGATGIVTIDGVGSLWSVNNSILNVGLNGSGTVNIQNGGEVVAENGTALAANGSASGTLNMNGGGILDTLSLTAGAGTPQANFDDGVLQARADNTNFITGFSSTELNIAAGGLEVDSAGFDVATDTTSAFTGAGGLTKTGAGTFTLLANNSYAGGTTITAGTLQLGNGGTSGSILGDVANDGILAFNRSDVITFGGVISGAGTIRQIGSGLTNLTGDSSAFTGTTSVAAGTLAVNGSLCGDMNVLAGGRLQGTGTVCDTTNAGIIAPGNSIGTLLIAGDYVGTGGVLEMEVVLGDTGSPADRLVITGNASGTTNINVINLGGTGAATGTGNTDGISIVQVGGTSTANTFQLPGGYAAVGPYQYELNAFAPGASAAGEADPLLGTTTFWDYRLQSLVDASGNPVPVPQIAGYQSLPSGALRYGAATLDSLHKRLGEIRLLVASRKANPNGAPAGEAFIRGHGSHSDVSGDDGPGYDQDIWFVQMGGNLLGWDVGERDATMRVGAALSLGGSSIDVDGSSASVDLKGTSLALTATYQAAQGWYVDAVAQGTRYSTGVKTSERGETGSPSGWGLGLSLEGGYPLDLGNKLIVEPQAQLVYQHAWFGSFTDVDDITVDLKGGDSLRGRLGGRVQKTFAAEVAKETALLSPYVEANVLHEFLNGDGITASGVTFASDMGGTSVQLGGGVDAQMTTNFAAFANISYEKRVTDGAANSWGGTAGVRLNW